MAEASVIELLIRLKDAMSGPAQKAETNLSRFGKSLQKFETQARHFKNVFYAGAAMEGMAWGLGEALKHFAEPAVHFQQAQEDLERATKLSTAQLAAFEHQATQLSDRWPRSATAITEAQANLVRTLGSAKAAMETVGIATEFATGTQTDLKAATDLLATAYENVGDKSLPLQAGFRLLADQLTVLQNKFSTSRENGEMLVRSFARLSGVAKVAGVSTTELMAAMGVLNKSGFAGGRGAGEYLAQAIERLGELGKNGIPTIEKFGIMLAGRLGARGNFHLNLAQTLKNMQHANPMRLQAYLKSLGQVGGTLRILMDRYGQLTAAVKTFQHAQGATYSLASEMNKGWHQQLEDMHNVWNNLERTLGQVLVPLLISMAQILEPILERFQRFAKAHSTIVAVAFGVVILTTGLLMLGGMILITTSAFGALAAAATMVSAGFADATAASWAFVASLLADPIFDVLAAFVALVVGAYELVKHWRAVEACFRRLGSVIKASLIEGWQEVEKFGDMVERLGVRLLNWFGTHPMFASLMGPIGWLMLAADELIKHWGSVEHFFVHLAHVLGNAFAYLERFLHLGEHTRVPPHIAKRHAAAGHPLHALNPAAANLLGAFSAPTPGAGAAQSQFVHQVTQAALLPTPDLGPLLSPAPVLAAGGSINGGVHFHVHMEGGSAGEGIDQDAQVDSMLQTLRDHQNDFVDVFTEINDRARGRMNSAVF